MADFESFPWSASPSWLHPWHYELYKHARDAVVEAIAILEARDETLSIERVERASEILRLFRSLDGHRRELERGLYERQLERFKKAMPSVGRWSAMLAEATHNYYELAHVAAADIASEVIKLFTDAGGDALLADAPPKSLKPLFDVWDRFRSNSRKDLPREPLQDQLVLMLQEELFRDRFKNGQWNDPEDQMYNCVEWQPTAVDEAAAIAKKNRPTFNELAERHGFEVLEGDPGELTGPPGRISLTLILEGRSGVKANSELPHYIDIPGRSEPADRRELPPAEQPTQAPMSLRGGTVTPPDEAAAAALKLLEKTGAMSLTSICDALYKAQVAADRKTISLRLKSMQASGLVSKGDGQKGKWFITPAGSAWLLARVGDAPDP